MKSPINLSFPRRRESSDDATSPDSRLRGNDSKLLCAAALMLIAAPAFAQKTPNPAADEGPSQNLQLDTTQITGSREQPTVMNILPWKHAGASELPGAPPDSLLNDVVQPVNRVEFRRELRYADPAGSTQSKP
jgi:hypothetical protein